MQGAEKKNLGRLQQADGIQEDNPERVCLSLAVHRILTRGKGKVPPADMDYAVIRKIRNKGRVAAITVEVVFGILSRIKEKIVSSPVSRNINISFIERSHFSGRQFNRRLTRKTLGFSRKLRNHCWQAEVEMCIHSLVRLH